MAILSSFTQNVRTSRTIIELLLSFYKLRVKNNHDEKRPQLYIKRKK